MDGGGCPFTVRNTATGNDYTVAGATLAEEITRPTFLGLNLTQPRALFVDQVAHPFGGTELVYPHPLDIRFEFSLVEKSCGKNRKISTGKLPRRRGL